jgi:hypothetical protein
MRRHHRDPFINEVKGVNRDAYDVTSKPPGTILARSVLGKDKRSAKPRADRAARSRERILSVV